MKHNLKVTLLLILIFLLAHFVGLLVTKHYLPEETSLPLNIQKPQFEEQTSYIPIFIAILVASALAMLLVRFGAMRLWRFWFFISVVFTLMISFNAFIPILFAITFAIILAIFKVFRPNVYIHNFTEIFIYGAISAIFVPILNVFSAIVLLVLISIYDMIAVWRTKHMIKMAKFQSKAKMFTGLLIPYRVSQRATAQRSEQVQSKKTLINKSKSKKIKLKVQEAILGGGDIGFPLLFSGVILKLYGFLPALIISFFTALALFGLFMYAEKKKFYPAMPFLTMGCLLGYLIVLILF